MMIAIGSIVFTIALSVPFGYHEADGSCLQFKDYPELGEVLHTDYNFWPYGLCKGGFRLPDLRSKNWKIGDPVAWIKIK